MQEIIIIFVITIAIFATTYIAVLLGFAIAECFIFLNQVPEWTWTFVLLALILTIMKGMRYSLKCNNVSAACDRCPNSSDSGCGT